MSIQHPVRFSPEGEWQNELIELEKRRTQALAMGGAQALAKLHGAGRMDVRQRIAGLLDPQSFQEMGCIAGKGHENAEGEFVQLDPTNTVTGTGRIHGRKIAIHADDFSIRAGSSEATVAEKWIYVERYAHQMCIPLVRLVDSAGGSVKLLMQLGDLRSQAIQLGQ